MGRQKGDAKQEGGVVAAGERMSEIESDRRRKKKITSATFHLPCITRLDNSGRNLSHDIPVRNWKNCLLSTNFIIASSADALCKVMLLRMSLRHPQKLKICIIRITLCPIFWCEDLCNRPP